MDNQGPIAASDMLGSLIGWWQLAGVESAVSDIPIDWLTLDAKPEIVQVPRIATPKQPEPVTKPKVDWPCDIEALRLAISEQVALPGNGYGNRSVVCVGSADCDVMMVSDRPDGDELSSGMLGTGTSGKLLERMLVAIGLNMANCYWTSLASTIPATGELPESDMPELGAFLRHKIALVRPELIISLGSAASRTLLGLELMEARQDLRYFNYSGRKVAVLTTFHPRTLITRPQMKSQAWKDLQMFAKKDIL